MRLDELFRDVPVLEKNHWRPHLKVQKVTSDSRMVGAGDVFVACRGSRMDGHDFAAQAVQAKAGVIVYENLPDYIFPSHVAAARVRDSNQALADLLIRSYGHPEKKIKLIGVTGTNGKTTVAYLLHRLLREHVSAAYLGTLWYDLPHEKIPAVNTTPGPELLIPLLDSMVKEKVRYCVMEVSSHALKQNRVHGLQFELAVFTQLTQDHLDYHRNMEDYFRSKQLLFSREPGPKRALVNIDCLYGKRLAEVHPGAKSLSLSFTQDADYRIKDIEPSFQGSRFVFCFKGREIPFRIRLPLLHNVVNVGQVLAGLDLLGYDPEDFRGVLQEIPGIPGRMERIAGIDSFQVFVDYAHTPDAVKNVIAETKKLRPKKIITVFGCGGDRDRLKRPLMGGLAAQYSDLVVLTSDNPRSEDPEMIMKDILKGIDSRKGARGEVLVLLDRREAIERALSLAEPGDVVLILGKGHEDYQILGDVKIPFDDRQVVQECLKRNPRVFLS